MPYNGDVRSYYGTAPNRELLNVSREACYVHHPSLALHRHLRHHAG